MVLCTVGAVDLSFVEAQIDSEVIEMVDGSASDTRIVIDLEVI